MYSGLKYLLFIGVVMLLSGCAFLRKAKEKVPPAGAAVTDYRAMANSVIDNNITDKGFEIRKGSIQLEGTEIEGKFGLHARLNSNGDFYASVRGPLGIELARILMVGNDIAAIDRFNKKIYVGKKDAVMKKNGLPEDFMKILFGDMPEFLDADFSPAANGEISVTTANDMYRTEMTVCTEEMKICRERIEAEESGHAVYLSFNSFRITEGKKYASEISMEERKKMFHVKLFIDDLIYGYESPIGFDLPSYEREKL